MNTLRGMIYGGLEQGRIIYGIDKGVDEGVEPVYFLDHNYRLYNKAGQFLTTMHPLELPNMDTLAYVSGNIVVQGWGCKLTAKTGYWGVE